MDNEANAARAARVRELEGEQARMLWRLQALERGLTDAAYLRFGTERHETRDHGFSAAVASLTVVVDFLETLGTFKRDGLTEPLVQLTIALLDVAEGHEHPMLKPCRPGHRPPDRELIKTLKGYAAAAMELLMRAGHGKRDAAQMVAKALADAGYRLPGRERALPRAGTVAAWRDQLIGCHDGGRMARAYASQLERAERVRLPPEEAAAGALNALESLVRQWNLDKGPS